MDTGTDDSIDALLRGWSGEACISRYDAETETIILIAIHSTRLGVATGGTRLKTYARFQDAYADALRLAEGMTYKFAVHGFRAGGGKAVLAVPQALSTADRVGLLRRYGAFIKQLNGLFHTGPDVGTSSADMDVIAETGDPYIHARTPHAGGAGDSSPATALGVFHAIATTCFRLYGIADLQGRRVAVQGVGQVGGMVVDRLLEAGAVVTVSDLDPAVLLRYRSAGVHVVAPEAIGSTPCDVFAPCALGGVLNADSIARLQCRAVVGAANNQLATPQDAYRLHARGILYAPDYVVNVGGAMAITGMETLGWEREEANRRVVRSVKETLLAVYEAAQQGNMPTTEAARARADAFLAAG